MKHLFILIITVLPVTSFAQTPYQSIPEAPSGFNSGTMAARMIDGLGFRFHWASEGLTAKDLEFKPSPDARSTEETIEHILNLSFSVVNTAYQSSEQYPEDIASLSYNEKREMTLSNLKKASEKMATMSDEEVAALKVMFAGGRTTDFPYWNMLNGPLADAIYHTGQLVTMRRASGNPINPNVNVFIGNVRN